MTIRIRVKNIDINIKISSYDKYTHVIQPFMSPDADRTKDGVKLSFYTKTTLRSAIKIVGELKDEYDDLKDITTWKFERYAAVFRKKVFAVIRRIITFDEQKENQKKIWKNIIRKYIPIPVRHLENNITEYLMDNNDELWKHFNVNWYVWVELSCASMGRELGGEICVVELTEEEKNNLRKLKQNVSFEESARYSKEQDELFEDIDKIRPRYGYFLINRPEKSVSVEFTEELSICQ